MTDEKKLYQVYNQALEIFAWKEEDLIRIQNINDKVLEIFSEGIKSLKLNADPFIGGSVAKKTFSRNFDIDIFIRFKRTGRNLSYKCEELMKFLVNRGFIKGYVKIHGSRDYFRTFIQGVKVEVVPIKFIRSPSEAENITDVSPFHVEWFKCHSNDVLSKDVIILKTFLRANRLYGAETYRRGLSGYLCELLVIYYNGFLNVLKGILDWKEKQIIDVSNQYKNESEIEKRFYSKSIPLIVVDPVDKSRNAAAALSYENFLKLKALVANFLKNPSLDFFYKKDLKQLSRPLLFFRVKLLDGNEDVVATNVVKRFRKLYNLLKEFDFNPSLFEYDFDFDQGIGEIVISCLMNISEDRLVIGPPLHITKDVENFKRKYKETFVKNNRVCALIKRQHTNPLTLVETFLSKLNVENNKFQLISFEVL